MLSTSERAVRKLLDFWCNPGNPVPPPLRERVRMIATLRAADDVQELLLDQRADVSAVVMLLDGMTEPTNVARQRDWIAAQLVESWRARDVDP